MVEFNGKDIISIEKLYVVNELSGKITLTVENRLKMSILGLNRRLWTITGHGQTMVEEEDIDQGSISDCYLLAAAGAFASQQPELIRQAIHYDAQRNSFRVTLYKQDHGWPLPVQVTQEELSENLSRSGAAGIDGPMWPAVLEAAFAKMHDRNPADGLGQGCDEIEGGRPQDAMLALSGQRGDVSMVTPALAAIEDQAVNDRLATMLPLGIGGHMPHGVASEKFYNDIKGALHEGRPITLGTGLLDGPRTVERHAYIVERIHKDEAGDIVLTVRNPWGHNDVGAFHSDNAVVDVKRQDLQFLITGHSFAIGPAPGTS